MRRSLRWPPRVTQGRLELTPDPVDPDLSLDDQGVALRQIIALSVQDGRGGHPFNAGIPLGVNDPTFQGVTNQSQGAIRGRIRDRFRTLERNRRARLVNVAITKETGTEQTGPILLVVIEYENLETGRRERLERTING